MEYSKSEGRRAKSQKRRRRIRQFLANIECSEKLRVLASSRPRCLSPSQLRDRSACDLNCCICAKNATSSCRAVISRRAMFVDSSGSFLRTTPMSSPKRLLATRFSSISFTASGDPPSPSISAVRFADRLPRQLPSPLSEEKSLQGA